MKTCSPMLGKKYLIPHGKSLFFWWTKSIYPQVRTNTCVRIKGLIPDGKFFSCAHWWCSKDIQTQEGTRVWTHDVAVSSSPTCERINDSQTHVWGPKAQFLTGSFSSVPTCDVLRTYRPRKGPKFELMMRAVSYMPSCSAQRIFSPMWGPNSEFLIKSSTSTHSCVEIRTHSTMCRSKTEVLMGAVSSSPSCEWTKDLLAPVH